MRTKIRMLPITAIVLLIAASLFFQPGPVGGASLLSTDKDTYERGETIKVHFSNSPGDEGDWICIVPAGAPDTEGGDYRYMPKGVAQGSLVFEPPKPGKYEARAYYNYNRNGYVVSGRHAFSVVGSPEDEANKAKLMERKIDPNNALEKDLPPGKGLVYIFREALFISSGHEVELIVNGKPLVFMGNSSYYPLAVPAGEVNLRAGLIRAITPNTPSVESARECKATVQVKPGSVYYVRLKLIPRPFWDAFLDPVPHAEGAGAISSYQMSQIGK